MPLCTSHSTFMSTGKSVLFPVLSDSSDGAFLNYAGPYPLFSHPLKLNFDHLEKKKYRLHQFIMEFKLSG